MFNMLFKKKQQQPIKNLSFDHYISSYVNKDAALPVSSIVVKQQFNEIFKDSVDFSERDFQLETGRSVYICYIAGLINNDQLEETVIKPLLMNAQNLSNVHDLGNVFTVTKYKTATSWKEAIDNILEGCIVLHIDQQEPIIIYLPHKNERSPQDPTTEYQVYGAKLGFVESSRKNIGIVRQFIKDPRLRCKEYQLGQVSGTHVSVMYFDGYCQPEVIQHLDSLLSSYNNEHLLGTGQLTKYISKHPYSLFPQTQKTERPDLVAFSLVQGKAIIFMDNSTFAIISPVTLMDMIETSEDRAFFVPWNLFFIRILRLISLFIGTILPALYVSLVAFQPELIPTNLTISVAQARINIPLPATAEAYLMMFALDVLVEASIRLPSFVGQTIGIVGGLVIGQAAVEAGLVSNTMVIVIAFTAIATFTLPSWEFVNSWRITRYLLVTAAAFLGLYGLVLAVGFLLVHLCKLDSMNKPFMYPFAPFDAKGIAHFFMPKR
ncbi:spore germination protein [Evansella cellulosilytica]|uniref:GerA spore germination protein n=1 Tax=Evansella cellulosilytica (strain ATCC 21833 / DSM 2522 / FERM P-1141 / JCM 9156 / N-4) TaxID=649639 RepID=E6U2A0_EVAC2|nr:spore germination protein [Evansella cellulosilytica]ADU30478.1 GerA spore germination protein [Evansella cellulosilytica DSM 2522]